MPDSTVGQFLVNDALPPELRDYNRTWDKATMLNVMGELARNHPDEYRERSHRLLQLGWQAAQEKGGLSFGLKSLQTPPEVLAIRDKIRKSHRVILDDDTIDDNERQARISKLLASHMKSQQNAVLNSANAAENPLVQQVTSGARGKPMNLASLLGSDLMYEDSQGRTIPQPVLHSFSEGLAPSEYWAGSYGARRGVVGMKMATADAGYLCLARGTMVRMADFTTKPIEAVQTGDWVLGADVKGRTFPSQVVAAIANGQKPLWRFRFRYGQSHTATLEIVATEEHRVLLRQIRRVRRRPNPKLIKSVTHRVRPLGDCESRSVSAFSLIPSQGFFNKSFGAREPWAWFIGLLLGNGGLTTNHLGFSCGSLDFVEIIRQALADDGFELRRKKNAKYEYLIADPRRFTNVGKAHGRNRLRLRIREYGLNGLHSPEKFIPDAVRGWNNKSVASLIRGIFDTDGCVGYSNNTTVPVLCLGMTAASVVYGVQSLLAMRFGIYGQVTMSKTTEGDGIGRLTTGFKGNHPCYRLCVSDRKSIERFAKYVNFTSPEKKKKFETSLARVDPPAYENGFVFHYLDREFVGTDDTFDIEVNNEDHLFVLANGAIVSNSKLLNQVSHRLVVTDYDASDIDDEDRPIRGMPTTTEDPDNEGSLLAHPAGGYPRHTVLSPKILHDLKARGVRDILVRSPIVGGPDSGGVYARDVGVREKGTLPGRGEMVGMQSAQSQGEPLSQGMLSVKHSGGVSGEEKSLSGFDRIAAMIQVPKIFPGGSVHAEEDGPVSSVTPAPAGGWHVMIGSQKHYVPQTRKLLVKPGDTVESGDRLTDGEPSPAEITRLKHIGEGRRYFTAAFGKAMQAGGIRVHRRNVELLARGLINHVKMDDIWGDHLPDEVVPYNLIESNWTPRDGHAVVDPRQAVGKYLEMPILHHTIGTRIKPSTVKEMQNFGVTQVTVHDEPPPFRPVMVRGMDSLHHDPDWMTRMYGSGLQKSFLDSVHTGGVSDETGTSFVPSLAKGIGFGSDQNAIHASEPGIIPSSPEVVPGSKKVSTMPYKTAAEASSGTKPKLSTAGGGVNATVDASTSLGGAGPGTMKTSVPAGPGVMPQVPWAVQAPPTFQLGQSPPGPPEPAKSSRPPAPAPASLPNSPGPDGDQQKPDLGWVGTALGPPAVKLMSQALPGIGGALALGSSFNPAAMGTFMKGPGGQSTFSVPQEAVKSAKPPSWVSPKLKTTSTSAVSLPRTSVDSRPLPLAAAAGSPGSAGPRGQMGRFGNVGEDAIPGLSAQPTQALETEYPEPDGWAVSPGSPGRQFQDYWASRFSRGRPLQQPPLQ